MARTKQTARKNRYAIPEPIDDPPFDAAQPVSPAGGPSAPQAEPFEISSSSSPEPHTAIHSTPDQPVDDDDDAFTDATSMSDDHSWGFEDDESKALSDDDLESEMQWLKEDAEGGENTLKPYKADGKQLLWKVSPGWTVMIATMDKYGLDINTQMLKAASTVFRNQLDSGEGMSSTRCCGTRVLEVTEPACILVTLLELITTGQVTTWLDGDWWYEGDLDLERGDKEGEEGESMEGREAALASYLEAKKENGKEMARRVSRAVDQLHLVLKYGCDLYLGTVKSHFLQLLLDSHMRDPWPIFVVAFKQGWKDVAGLALIVSQQLTEREADRGEARGEDGVPSGSILPWNLSDERVAELGLEGYAAYTRAFKGLVDFADEEQVTSVVDRMIWNE